VSQGRAWKPRPIPPPQPGAGLPRVTGAAPVLGISHLPGDGDRAGCRAAGRRCRPR